MQDWKRRYGLFITKSDGATPEHLMSVPFHLLATWLSNRLLCAENGIRKVEVYDRKRKRVAYWTRLWQLDGRVA